MEGKCERNSDDQKRANFEGRFELGHLTPVSELETGQGRGHWLDVGIAKKKREAAAEDKYGDADGNVVYAGSLGEPGVDEAESHSREARDEDAEPRRAASIRHRVGAHGTEEKGALEA